MPDWVLRGPVPPEVATPERCFITERLNDPAHPAASLAQARVAPGVTTQLHALTGIAEVYLIRSGSGLMEVGGVSALVEPGDRILIPPGTPQRITNTGARDLVFDCLCTPRFVPEAYVALGE
jgi:mannose-6-phosphate isomerase-like protein (cupin superfamily)